MRALASLRLRIGLRDLVEGRRGLALAFWRVDKDGSGLVPVKLALKLVSRFLVSPLARREAAAHLDLAWEAGMVEDNCLRYGLLIDVLAHLDRGCGPFAGAAGAVSLLGRLLEGSSGTR